MRLGAWIHKDEDAQVRRLAESGMTTTRGYSVSCMERIVPVSKELGLTHLGGLHVDAAQLLIDWRSQVKIAEMAQLHAFGVPLDAVCVGNELREYDNAASWKFTPALAGNLTKVLSEYRRWLNDNGHSKTRLTYAIEGTIMNADGSVQDFMLPVLDACDVVSVNLYPMAAEHWFTFDAFPRSKQLLTDSKVRKERFADFEKRLRQMLNHLKKMDKPMFLTETGFPSGVDVKREEGLLIPINDDAAYGAAFIEFMTMISQVNKDFDGRLEAIYFYEWWDNLWHGKIQTENSPIHICFGLCDHEGNPKFDLKKIVDSVR